MASSAAAVRRALRQLQRRLDAAGGTANRAWLKEWQDAVDELPTFTGKARLLSTTDAAALADRVQTLIDDFSRRAAADAAALATENAATSARVVADVLESGVRGAAARAVAMTVRALGTPGQQVAGGAGVAQDAVETFLKRLTGKTDVQTAAKALTMLLNGDSPVNIGLPGVGIPPGLRGFASRMRMVIGANGWTTGQQAIATSLQQTGRVLVAQWTLSPDHDIEDECDDLAEADVGFGPGWYPPNAYPSPPHPYCRCTQGDVQLRDEDGGDATPPAPTDEPPPDEAPDEALTTSVSGTNQVDTMSAAIATQLASGNFIVEEKAAAAALGISPEEFARHGDGVLAGIYKQQGFDAAPTVLSREEFEALVTENNLRVGYRGVAGNAYAEAFQSGEYYAGVGISGNGTYAAFQELEVGATLPPGGLPPDGNGALRTARSYAGVGTESVTKIALKPDATVWTMAEVLDAQAEAQKVNSALYAEARGLALDDPRRIALDNELNAREMLTTDTGRFAASLGVDAYVAKGSTFNDASYLVILNRNAVIMQQERLSVAVGGD